MHVQVHVPMDHMEGTLLVFKSKMSEDYTYVLMQLDTRSPPYVPYNTPMPNVCKQVLYTCTKETMYIGVLLLVHYQSLST